MAEKACESCPAPKIADCSQCCDVDSLWEFVTSPTNSINGPTWVVMQKAVGGGMGGGMGGTQGGGHIIKYTAKDSENCGGEGNEIQSGKATRMFHATEDFELTVKMLTNHESRKDHDIANLKLYQVSPCCTGVCDIESINISVKPCGCECKQEKNNKWKAYNKTSTGDGACVAEDEPRSLTEYESIEECLCDDCGDEGYCSGACCAPGDDPTPCEVITKNECEEKEWNYSGKDTSCMIRKGENVCPYEIRGACCNGAWPDDGPGPMGGMGGMGGYNMSGLDLGGGLGATWHHGGGYAPDGYPCVPYCDIRSEESCLQVCDDDWPCTRGTGEFAVWHGEGSSCDDGCENLYPSSSCVAGDTVTGPTGSGVILVVKNEWYWTAEDGWQGEGYLIKNDSGIAWVGSTLVSKDGIPCGCGDDAFHATGACCSFYFDWRGHNEICNNTTAAACAVWSSSGPNVWHGLGTVCEELMRTPRGGSNDPVVPDGIEWYDRDFNLHDCAPPPGPEERWICVLVTISRGQVDYRCTLFDERYHSEAQGAGALATRAECEAGCGVLPGF